MLTGFLRTPSEVMATLRLRDVCDLHSPMALDSSLEREAPGVRLVTGSDLFKEVLTTEEITPRQVAVTPADATRLRPGDILVPTITRRPCARLVGSSLHGCYAHHTVAIVRP